MCVFFFFFVCIVCVHVFVSAEVTLFTYFGRAGLPYLSKQQELCLL